MGEHYERKTDAFYVWKVRSRYLRQISLMERRNSDADHKHLPFSYFLCNWVGIRDILLLSHVFTSDLQACTGKPEISPAHFKDPWIFCKTKVYGSAAQDTPHLQVSKLQTEDPCSKGKGKIEIRCPKCQTTFIKKS